LELIALELSGTWILWTRWTQPIEFTTFSTFPNFQLSSIHPSFHSTTLFAHKQTIGRGSFAEVRLSRNIKTSTPAQLSNPNEPYTAVVKITNLLQLHDPQIQRVQLQREIATLMELGEHAHIVKGLFAPSSIFLTFPLTPRLAP
jgi:serine/threonine protein kinase